MICAGVYLCGMCAEEGNERAVVDGVDTSTTSDTIPSSAPLCSAFALSASVGSSAAASRRRLSALSSAVLSRRRVPGSVLSSAESPETAASAESGFPVSTLLMASADCCCTSADCAAVSVSTASSHSTLTDTGSDSARAPKEFRTTQTTLTEFPEPGSPAGSSTPASSLAGLKSPRSVRWAVWAVPME